MKNLTPHTLNVLNANGELIAIPASGEVARLSVSQVELESVNGFTVRTTEYGEVEGVPAPGAERFIVSASVLGQLGPEYRGWAFAPDTGPTCVRENGQVKYVTALVTV